MEDGHPQGHTAANAAIWTFLLNTCTKPYYAVSRCPLLFDLPNRHFSQLAITMPEHYPNIIQVRSCPRTLQQAREFAPQDGVKQD